MLADVTGYVAECRGAMPSSLQDGGHAHAAGGADGDQSTLALFRIEDLRQCGDDARPGGAEGVAQRKAPAAHVQAGSIDSAVKQAKLVQAKFAKAPTGYMLEGDIYANQKRWDEAERAYAAGQKAVPVPAFVVRRVQVADMAGTGAKGDALAAEWIREQPKDMVVRTFLGERALKLKDYRASFNYYSTALAQQPENALLLNNVAWTGGKIGDPKALDYAAKAAELAPDAPAVIDTYGTLLVERGQTERGLEMLHKAVHLAPAAAELRKNLGVALIKAGKKSEARTELETALRLPDAARIKGEIEAALKTL